MYLVKVITIDGKYTTYFIQFMENFKLYKMYLATFYLYVTKL